MTVPKPCSVDSERLDEQLAGTAAHAVAYVLLEQSGPWGAKALTDSHLDGEIGRELEARTRGTGVRPMLVRRPGRHSDTVPDAGRTLLVASCVPGSTWTASAVVEDPAIVLDLDVAAIARGEMPAFLSRDDRPQLLVCTNGSRDVCCAVRGRPVALGAATARPGQVWEVTHTGGHRFAPTAVLIPAGTVHGRLTVESAVELIDAAANGHTVLDGSRGRSCWQPAGQVAELAVRRATGDTALDALRVDGDGDGGTWTVSHVDGRAWRVTTTVEDAGYERAPSCGKAPEPVSRIVVTGLADAGR